MLWLHVALAFPPPVAPPRNRIVNGTPTPSHRNVVAIAVVSEGADPWVFCTGTLVHPSYVVTAAHCLVDLSLDRSQVLIGSDLRSGTAEASIPIAQVWPHPDYESENFLNDIGVIELEFPVADVAISAVNDDLPQGSWLGEAFRFVGFGDPFDGAFQTGTKRFTDIPLTAWDSQYLYFSDPETNICQGDSGGPAFERTPDGLELAGVNAFVINGCEGGQSGATRVDAFIPWLNLYIPTLVVDPSQIPPDEADTDTDTDTDSDIDTELPWGAPTTPTPGTYRKQWTCQNTISTDGPVFIGLFVGLFALRRRRTE